MSTAATNQESNTAGSSRNLFALMAGLTLLAYAPSLWMHFQELWDLEQYQYFPFVIGAVAWLGWTRWQEASEKDPAAAKTLVERLRAVLAPIWFVLSLIAMAVAVYCQWGWFAALSLNLLLGAFLILLTKRFHIRNAWGIWALLWLNVPPPIEFGTFVVQRMQLISSILSRSRI